jgi:transcription initiation factor IIE alpha subunit
MPKKKKMKDKRRMQIKKRKQAERLLEEKKDVTFICLDCKVTEDIPRGVVESFDVFDDGDLSVPPRFTCEKCGGTMEPIKYSGVHGITYEISEENLG